MIGKAISGRYKIIQNLGSGGFGQTFLAEDLQLPDHPQCVVKRLKPATSETFLLQTASRLFDTEARVLHRLGSHDRIPRLLAHFEEDGEFYLVQELIEGHDLTNELIPNSRSADGYPVGRMDEAQAIIFLMDVLETLAFVHHQGAIHRDIKPANLMRRRNDGRLVLIDFGAVKQVGTATVIGSTVAIGTDGYMPNEQAIGKPRPCSDLYAVGAIAIQGLTGALPSQLAEDMQTGELAWRKSPANWGKYRAEVSDSLAKIIDKLIKYDFRARYQTAEEVLADVQLLHVPISPTILQFTTKGSSQESTVVTKSGYESLPTVMPKVDLKDKLRLKRKHLLSIGVAGMISAIAILGTFMFLRPSPTLKNDVNLNATLPDAKYLFVSERSILDADLANKSAVELDIMRNEVYARYGRRFQDPELQSYFNSQPWYQPRYEPDKFPEALLTPIEIQNVQYIKEFQIRLAQKPISSQNNPNNSPNNQCDFTKRLISDPNPPINVRLGAGQEHAIVGTLTNGTEITVSGERQGWFQISAPIIGWVAANRTKPICL